MLLQVICKSSIMQNKAESQLMGKKMILTIANIG